MKLVRLPLAALALVLVLLPQQASAQQPSGGGGGNGGSGASVQASESYVIVPLDVLRFRIVGEPETETEVRVAADGKVTLPYVGSVRVGGMSVYDAREHLFKLYDADYYVNPQIDMAVIGYKQRRVNVQGFVNRQGFVVFPPEEDMTLLGAIALAGGWSDNRLADKGRVKLTRTLPDGTSKEYTINVRDISQTDWPLQDGDYIFIPERVW